MSPLGEGGTLEKEKAAQVRGMVEEKEIQEGRLQQGQAYQSQAHSWSLHDDASKKHWPPSKGQENTSTTLCLLWAADHLPMN